MLLEAEQAAQLIVNNARAAKALRLQQVKEEAAREAAQYRAKCETEFRRKLAQASGDTGALAKQIEGQTFQKLQTMRSAANRFADETATMLVGYVTNCKNNFGDAYIEEQDRHEGAGPSTSAAASILSSNRTAARTALLSHTRASLPAPSVSFHDLSRSRASLPAPAVSFDDDEPP